MKKISLCLIGLLLISQTAFGAITKDVESLDAWTAVGRNTLGIGNSAAVSGNYQTLVVIDAALTSATAPTNGLQIVVDGSNSTTGNNNWYPIATYSCLTATAATQNITDNPLAVGSTVFTATTTTGFTTEGTQLYIKDSTIANSEVRTISSFNSTTVTAESGTTNQHAQNTPMWNKVFQQVVSIPDSTNRIRVRYDNTQDATGSTADVRANISKITGI